MTPTPYSRKTSDIFISEKLRILLEQFKNASEIAKSLLYRRVPVETLVDSHVNYICISESDPTKISYLTQDRISKIETSTSDDYWTSTQRFHCKPGTFVGKIFKDVPSKEIEKFSSLFKSFSNRGEFSFEVISGDRIIEFYNHEKYASQRGSLGASCMKLARCGDYLDLYTKNPDKISMLIMKAPTQLIIGRALLWNFIDEISGENVKIMDRIYTIQDDWDFSFKKWATDNEYLYKSKQSWANTLQFENDITPQKEIKLSMKLNSYLYRFYPYLDTFKWIDVEKGILYNYLPDDFDDNNHNHRLLIFSDGRYERSRYLGFDDIERDWSYRADLVYLEDEKMWTDFSNCKWIESLNKYVLFMPKKSQRS